MNKPLPDELGYQLVALARAAISNELGIHASYSSAEDRLRAPGATFVTIERDGKMRGCIGTLSAYRSIADDVAENALAAAFNDPRFPPLQVGELDEITIAVALLTPPQPVEYDGTESGAIAALRPGVDGVILRAGRHHAHFLPDVWQHVPDAKQFLADLKRQARLEPHFWSPEVKLERFETQQWRE